MYGKEMTQDTFQHESVETSQQVLTCTHFPFNVNSQHT